MAKEKKISVRTPAKVYQKLLQRAYELDLNHREYLLSLALLDLEMVEGHKSVLSPELARKVEDLIKELDQEGQG